MTYRDYLKSDHWRELKKHKLKRTEKKCAICGTLNQIDCHHVLYKNIHDVTTADLRWLCRPCHERAHELIRAGQVRPSKKNRANPQTLFILLQHAFLRDSHK